MLNPAVIHSCPPVVFSRYIPGIGLGFILSWELGINSIDPVCPHKVFLIILGNPHRIVWPIPVIIRVEFHLAVSVCLAPGGWLIANCL